MALLTSLNHRLLSRRALLSAGAAAGLSAVLLPLASEAADVIGTQPGKSDHSGPTSPRQRLRISGGDLPKPDGPTAKPSRIVRRVLSLTG